MKWVYVHQNNNNKMVVQSSPEKGRRENYLARPKCALYLKNWNKKERGLFSYQSISSIFLRADTFGMQSAGMGGVVYEHQCDQIGQLFLSFGNKFSYKSCPNILVIFGLFEIIQLSCKKWFGYFLGNIGKNWTTFYFIIWSHCQALTAGPWFES